MGALLRIIESFRLSLLFLTAPYAVLWTSGSHSGGWVMVVVFTLLILLYALSLDCVMLRAGQDPRIGLLPDRHAFPNIPQLIARFVVIELLILFILILIFIEPLLALYSAVAMIAILWSVRSARGREGASRFLLAEWWWAVGMLIVPMILVSLRRWAITWDGAAPEGPDLPAHALAATILGAAIMAVFVLLCLLRDDAKDDAAGYRTTATLFGREGDAFLLILWMLVAITLSIWGITQGWWAWPVAAVISMTSVLAVRILDARHERGAIIMWWLGGSVAALIILFTAPTIEWTPPAAPSPVSSEAQSQLIDETIDEVDSTP